MGVPAQTTIAVAGMLIGCNLLLEEICRVCLERV